MADLGSGGGLPGIPVALALPGVQHILIERSSKKAAFLRQVVLELNLPHVEVVCADAGRREPVTDPRGPEDSAVHHVLRGGSWMDVPASCRSAGRLPWPFAQRNVGFRPVRDLPE